MSNYPVEASITVDYSGLYDSPAEAARALVDWLRDGGLTEAYVSVSLNDGSSVTVSPEEIANQEGIPS